MQLTTHPKGQAFTPVFAILLSLAFTGAARAEKVTLVAGGTGGDAGPGNQAKMSKVFAVAVDKAGNMYIGQFGTKTDGQLVRKVDPVGMVPTLRVRTPGHLCCIGEK